MAKLRVYIDLDSIKEIDSSAIEVLQCESPEDTGTAIETVKLKAGVDYVEFSSATDPFAWFKLNVLDPGGGVILESDEPVLAEYAQDKINFIRKELKDTAEVDPAFSDPDLISRIRMSALRYNKIRNLNEVPESVWSIITILVKIDCAYTLAYDFAKYMKLEIPGGAALSKDELYKHYIEVANALESYYTKIKDELTKKGSEDIGNDGDVIKVHISDMELDRSGI